MAAVNFVRFDLVQFVGRALLLPDKFLCTLLSADRPGHLGSCGLKCYRRPPPFLWEHVLCQMLFVVMAKSCGNRSYHICKIQSNLDLLALLLW